jgi:RNA polymerase sigma-70 factor (ECF subfamily)
MNEAADRLAGAFVKSDDDILREFEARLADSSGLAVRVAYSVVRHQQDAEDVAQEAFARAYRRFGQLRERDAFRAWLVRMTWRLALDFVRRDRRRLAREEAASPPVSTAGHEDDAIKAQRSARLWQAIDALPEKLRLVVVLVSIEEQSVREAAALLDVPEGTVKSRLFDARQKLKELLT